MTEAYFAMSTFKQNTLTNTWQLCLHTQKKSSQITAEESFVFPCGAEQFVQLKQLVVLDAVWIMTSIRQEAARLTLA